MEPVALLERPLVSLDHTQDDESSNISDLTQRVSRIAANNLEAPQPIDGESLSAERVSSEPAAPKNMNIALSIILLGLRVEEKTHRELDGHIKEASSMQKTIEQLINISGKLSIHTSDKDVLEISEEVKAMAQSLKEKGIEIFDGNEGKINRERVTELKAHIGSHIERLKTDLQKTFSTVIQVKINELQSLLECLKTIEKYSSRLIQSILSHTGAR